MYDAPLYRAVLECAGKDQSRFFMPGHKGRGDLPGFLPGGSMPFDLTELPGTGNLYADEGPFPEARRLAARAFGAKKTFFLTGGSSQGIHTALLLTAGRGGKILVDRNCHASVIGGLILAGLRPAYIRSEQIAEFGIPAGVRAAEVERAFGLHPDAAAVLITSPTYCGVLSDIAGIAKECGKKKAVLIVDEAHGAHLAFSGLLPGGALSAGADIVVQSGHKTLPVFTPGAYLHFNMEADDGRVLETMLACGSSSPSYLVAASLDFARAYMEQNGAENIRLIVENNRNISNSIEKDGLMKSLATEAIRHYNIIVDETRLVLGTGTADMTGRELSEALSRRGVGAEMAGGRYVVLIPSVCTPPEDFERLAAALSQIAGEAGQRRKEEFPVSGHTEIPAYAMSPREAFFAPRERVGIEESLGLICAETVSPYPPGTVLIAPGERIDGNILGSLRKKSINTIAVVREK